MSGVDVLKSFTDTKLLNQHSLNEFTLHARGQIKIGDDKQQLPLLTDVPIDRDLCSTLEPDNVYKHLMSRGYQYGSLFRLIQSLHNTQSIVEGEIDCTIASQDNVPVYNLIHPAVLDACLHPALAILPGISTTFIPVSINKITIYGEISTLNSPVQVRAAYHDNICGIAKQRTYEFDCTICSNDTEMRKPLISFDRITIQQVQGSQSGLWASNTSVFDKLNILVDLPNQELTTHLDTIMNNYCLKTVWNDERIRIGAADLLPSTEYIIKTHIDSTGNEDLIESIEPLNLLAAYYAQMALEDLTLVPIQEQQQESLLAACRSLTFHSKAKPTYHSTQIYLMQLLRQFPRLTPILSVLSTCGQNLRQVLNGQYDGIDVLLGNEKMESELQEIQSLISSHQTYFIFDILNQYLQEKFGKILAERKLRIFWLGSGNNSDDLRVFLLLLDLSEKTDILIDINYTNSNPHVLEQVEKTFTTQLKDQNRIRIIYDDKFDLFNNENNKNMIVESYDIIFGANKLQGNQDLSYSLVILRQLLVPNGLLLLLELTDAPLYFDIIYGLIDQWWSPVDHRRALLNINQWTRSIREIDGFETVQTRNTSFGNSFIVVQKSTSSKVLTMLEERQSQAWLIFDDDSTPSMGNALKSLLPSVNITLLHASNSSSDNICSKIEEMMTTYAQVHIVFAWSLNQKSINDDSEMAIAQYETNICDTFIHILQTIQTAEPQSHPFVYVLTQNVQPGAGSDLNPIGSPLIGLARSLALEYEQHHLKLIDLQSKSSPAMIPSLVRTLTEHLITSRYADDLDEIVLQHDKQTDTIHRLEWHYEMLQEEQDINESVKSEQTTIIPHNDADQQPFRLQVAPSRFLDDLTWVPDVKKNILHTDKIEVRVHCVGINFRDVLKSSGRYPYMRPFAQTSNDQAMVDRDTEPGIDFIGTVARTHSNEKVKVGDRVFGMAPGVFHSHVHLSPNEYVRIPDDCNHFTDEQLAALPNACMTVLYSLKYRVNLQPGQTVLVHAATGGTGQACIQYCQSIGARVLATAGTDEKRRFLREHYGIEHVFNSRDLSFVNGVRALLPNGVDIIVNSLSGSFLQESVKLLASQGHFIEWGKRDLFDKKKLSMFDLRDDCSFHVIDITSLYVHRRDIFGQLIEELLQLIIKGVFKPIEPTKAYEPSDIIDIFKQCNNGQMSGKFVLRLTNSQQPLNLNCQSPPQCTEEEDPMFPFEVCHQGTILISGGCGGLGLTMSRWMIEKRCVKRLTLMSRRTVAQIEQEDNPEYGEWQRLQQAAKKYDAHIDLVQIDVTNFEDVRNLIEQLSQTPYPIRGIIHSAVVQEDRSLGKLSQENLIHVLGPKARGAWNLHRASELAAPSLHFFVLFSSIRNHMIDLASGGYNAGNQFLDILARYRAEKLNLPALSVSLPAVSGAGMFHRHREMLTSLQNTSGFELVPTVGVFELIDRFHVNQKSCPCPIIFAANWKQLYENRDKLVTHQLRKIAIQQYTIANGSSMLTISSDDVDSFDSIYDKLETIVERTQITVARLLGASSNDQISLDRSLVSQGMDSLAAVSLYNWLGQETNIFIPLADLLQGLSIQTIAEQVHKKLHKKKRTDTESNDSGIDFHIESIEDNETNLSNNLSYTGTENILCIRRPINSECPILFYILPNSTSDNTHMPEIIVEKISKNNNSPLPAAIYTINKPQASMTKDITKIANMMIAQMRRIQPYGPYKLVTTRGEQGEVVAGEMTNQLKRHSVDSTIQLLS
ncbi:hypothetical protein I4U23_022095 [Adineta vaga]|nr:hypothetical protein I4U23_022095 [Adineta vaga]